MERHWFGPRARPRCRRPRPGLGEARCPATGLPRPAGGRRPEENGTGVTPGRTELDVMPIAPGLLTRCGCWVGPRNQAEDIRGSPRWRSRSALRRLDVKAR